MRTLPAAATTQFARLRAHQPTHTPTPAPAGPAPMQCVPPPACAAGCLPPGHCTGTAAGDRLGRGRRWHRGQGLVWCEAKEACRQSADTLTLPAALAQRAARSLSPQHEHTHRVAADLAQLHRQVAQVWHVLGARARQQLHGRRQGGRRAWGQGATGAASAPMRRKMVSARHRSAAPCCGWAGTHPAHPPRPAPCTHRANLVFIDGLVVGALLGGQLHPNDDLAGREGGRGVGGREGRAR